MAVVFHRRFPAVPIDEKIISQEFLTGAWKNLQVLTWNIYINSACNWNMLREQDNSFFHLIKRRRDKKGNVEKLQKMEQPGYYSKEWEILHWSLDSIILIRTLHVIGKSWKNLDFFNPLYPPNIEMSKLIKKNLK